MAVEKDRRGARPVQPVAVDVGVDAVDLENADVLDARRAYHVRGGVGGAAHLLRREAGGGDAGDAAERDQLALEVSDVGVEVVEGGLHEAVPVGHHSSRRINATKDDWQFRSESGAGARRPPGPSGGRGREGGGGGKGGGLRWG